MLEQQDRETGAAGDGVEPLLLGQHLDHHGSRRHCQGEADDSGADSIMPKKDGKAATSIAAESTTCREPRPNTKRRITQSRSNESSRPIINSSSTTPSWAIGSIDAGVLIVIAESQGRWGMSEASPNGPTTMPTSIKPSTGLTRRR